MSDEYRLRITVRNNLLLSAIEAAGYKSQADFARAANLSPAQVNSVVAMRFSPINQLGEFTPVAKSIMETLGACPSDLWTDYQLNLRLSHNGVDRVVDESAVHAMLEDHSDRSMLPSPEDVVDELKRAEIAGKLLETLRPRDAHVIRRRMDGDSLDEIADSMHLTRERVRQIELKAMRALRDPNHSGRKFLLSQVGA